VFVNIYSHSRSSLLPPPSSLLPPPSPHIKFSERDRTERRIRDISRALYNMVADESWHGADRKIASTSVHRSTRSESHAQIFSKRSTSPKAHNLSTQSLDRQASVNNNNDSFDDILGVDVFVEAFRQAQPTENHPSPSPPAQRSTTSDFIAELDAFNDQRQNGDRNHGRSKPSSQPQVDPFASPARAPPKRSPSLGELGRRLHSQALTNASTPTPVKAQRTTSRTNANADDPFWDFGIDDNASDYSASTSASRAAHTAQSWDPFEDTTVHISGKPSNHTPNTPDHHSQQRSPHMARQNSTCSVNSNASDTPISLNSQQAISRLPLEQLFLDPKLKQEFITFCSSDYSEPQALLYAALLDYEQLQTLAERKARAEDIVAIFFAPNAPMSVSLPSRIIVAIMQQLHAAPLSLFRDVCDDVGRSLRMGSFDRFTRTSVYKNALKKRLKQQTKKKKQHHPQPAARNATRRRYASTTDLPLAPPAPSQRAGRRQVSPDRKIKQVAPVNISPGYSTLPRNFQISHKQTSTRQFMDNLFFETSRDFHVNNDTLSSAKQNANENAPGSHIPPTHRPTRSITVDNGMGMFAPDSAAEISNVTPKVVQPSLLSSDSMPNIERPSTDTSAVTRRKHGLSRRPSVQMLEDLDDLLRTQMQSAPAGSVRDPSGKPSPMPLIPRSSSRTSASSSSSNLHSSAGASGKPISISPIHALFRQLNIPAPYADACVQETLTLELFPFLNQEEIEALLPEIVHRDRVLEWLDSQTDEEVDAWIQQHGPYETGASSGHADSIQPDSEPDGAYNPFADEAEPSTVHQSQSLLPHRVTSAEDRQQRSKELMDLFSQFAVPEAHEDPQVSLDDAFLPTAQDSSHPNADAKVPVINSTRRPPGTLKRAASKRDILDQRRYAYLQNKLDKTMDKLHREQSQSKLSLNDQKGDDMNDPVDDATAAAISAVVDANAKRHHDPDAANDPYSQESLKRVRQRSRICMEIIETERRYVQHLNILVVQYLRPLERGDVPKMDVEDVRSIFSNVAAISAFHQLFLLDLEKAEFLSSVFIRHAPYFKLYSQYVSQYTGCLSTMNRLSHIKAFQQFLERKRSDDATERKDIMSYLIMPVQRLPRYVLLLRELLKWTDEDHPEYKDIMRALYQAEQAATFVNERKRNVEMMSEVVAMQNQISSLPDDLELVTPSRRLIRAACVNYESRGLFGVSIKECMVVLFNDVFLWASVHWRYKGHLNLSNAVLSDPDPSSLHFAMFGKDSQLMIVADNAADKEFWLRDIRGCIKRCHAQYKSQLRRRSLAMERMNSPKGQRNQSDDRFE
jgi:RhoGEF domain/Regulator of G protein signaling domain